MSTTLKVINYQTGEWEEREPYDRAFLEFVVQTGSQYDDTCRRMAAQILATEDKLAVLQQQLSPRLRVWELTGGGIWCVATVAEDCWAYLNDHHGNPDEITELQEGGACWEALPDDKKLSIYVDSEGDICGIDDGGPLLLPCWVWAVRRGVGFLAEEG